MIPFAVSKLVTTSNSWNNSRWIRVVFSDKHYEWDQWEQKTKVCVGGLYWTQAQMKQEKAPSSASYNSIVVFLQIGHVYKSLGIKIKLFMVSNQSNHNVVKIMIKWTVIIPEVDYQKQKSVIINKCIQRIRSPTSWASSIKLSLINNYGVGFPFREIFSDQWNTSSQQATFWKTDCCLCSCCPETQTRTRLVFYNGWNSLHCNISIEININCA